MPSPRLLWCKGCVLDLQGEPATLQGHQDIGFLPILDLRFLLNLGAGVTLPRPLKHEILAEDVEITFRVMG
ncbi:hypothetical protein ASNO1_27150 [Corallococcus caeni]|uniref:Uncharacterized protein n=1 Tax=Corallococcus caeni TaxID=3082388 RepID=A0ABQ6QR12_9BACT|nr:hypothetical protein ASNO1_27150 [Corallococcus sp. NO1]